MKKESRFPAKLNEIEYIFQFFQLNFQKEAFFQFFQLFQHTGHPVYTVH